MSENDRHVVPQPNGGWDVKAPHSERASSHHSTQAEAIDRAREIIANAGGGELVTHGTDGRIRESDTVAAAARHDVQQAVEPLAMVEFMAVSADPFPVAMAEPASAETMPSPELVSTEEDEPKLSLGDKVKNLLHRSSD
jgi:hypothetical protein